MIKMAIIYMILTGTISPYPTVSIVVAAKYIEYMYLP